MEFGLGVPPDRDFADPEKLVALAIEAEAAGWDGFFLWDHLTRRPPWPPVVDPWVVLAAVAQATETIRLGPMVTPLARRRPAVVARATATLDRLSGGRLLLGVGLGSPDDEFWRFGDDPDPRVRAARLDEALEVITGLWTGEPFSFAGEHFSVDGVQFEPTPVNGRVPIWVAGRWPNRAPLRRAARHDGFFPVAPRGRESLTPDEIRAALDLIAPDRSPGAAPLAVAAQLVSPPGFDPRVEEYGGAGLTWWVERLDRPGVPLAELRDRVAAGPPVPG